MTLIFIVKIPPFFLKLLEADADVIHLFQRIVLSNGGTSHGKVILKGSKGRDWQMAKSPCSRNYTTVEMPSFNAPLLTPYWFISSFNRIIA